LQKVLDRNTNNHGSTSHTRNKSKSSNLKKTKSEAMFMNT